jgi:hypothetical protein
VGVESERPGPASRLRIGALSAIRRGPAGVLPAFILAVLVASGAAVVILTAAAADGPAPTLNEWVLRLAVASTALSAIAGLAYLVQRSRSRGADAGRPTDPSSSALTAALLAGGLLSFLALVPVWLLAARTHPPTEHWLAYGFVDRRWVTTTFLLGTLGSMLVLTVVAQFVETAASGPPSWREWAMKAFGLGRFSRSIPPEIPAAATSWTRVAGLIVLAFALATYFFGPPWHIDPSPIDSHETVPMGGVQAVSRGALPYIGSAAVQYGPGAEVIPYLYLKATHFDFEGLRQSTVLFFWLGATIFFSTILLRIRLKLALVICVVSAVLFPCLQLISFDSAGSVSGFWGWANALRYVGVFAVAMLFPAAAATRTRRNALASGLALGLLWGFTCFMAQENLIGGVMALASLSVLLVATRTVAARRLADALLGIAVGFAAIAVPVFAYYAANGELSRFLKLYYLVPGVVAAGYSNTSYLEGFGGVWGHMYYVVPFLLACLCLLSLVQLHPVRVARDWAPERVLLVSALVAASVAHLGALGRADASHLINTMIGLPVAIVLSVAYLPSLLGIGSSTRRSIVAVALAAFTLALLPFYQLKHAGDRIWFPLHARIAYEEPSVRSVAVNPGSVAASRIGTDLVRRPGPGGCCSQSNASMAEFATLLNQLHRRLGDRRVYIASFVGDLYPGAGYFLGDLHPAPFYLEPYTMVVNETIQKQFLSFFDDHISDVDAVVAVDTNAPEVALFEAANPGYDTATLPFNGDTVTVLTRG